MIEPKDLSSYKNFSPFRERRALLVANMRSNEALGHDCKACTGTCCTFVNNTMQVSPLEALDIFMDMATKQQLTPLWRNHLENCVREYGLDRGDVGNGSRSLLRRSYTCPFFNRAHWGCGVDVDRKPYGCLAFNPIEPNIADGGSCRSSQSDLQEREETWMELEQKWNGELKLDFNLSWNKLDIPRAVLDIWKHF